MSRRPARRHPEEPVPEIRPFRALRYDRAVVGDPALVVAPPYDVIGPDLRAPPGRSPPGERRPPRPARPRSSATSPTIATGARRGPWPRGARTGRCARTRTRRSTSTSRRTSSRARTSERTQRGFFARLRLEPFGPDAGRPAARADARRAARGPLQAAPRDRRQHEPGRRRCSTTSPGATAQRLALVAAGPPDLEVTDDDGVRHRLWAVPADGEGASAEIARGAHRRGRRRGPVTIADGHHRYETALQYRDERRMTRSCEEDPAFDYLLTLFLEATGEPLTVLPTHRLVRGLGDDAAAALLDAAPASCSRSSAVGTRGDAACAGSRAPGWPTGGAGRFGLWTRRRRRPADGAPRRVRAVPAAGRRGACGRST